MKHVSWDTRIDCTHLLSLKNEEKYGLRLKTLEHFEAPAKPSTPADSSTPAVPQRRFTGKQYCQKNISPTNYSVMLEEMVREVRLNRSSQTFVNRCTATTAGIFFAPPLRLPPPTLCSPQRMLNSALRTGRGWGRGLPSRPLLPHNPGTETVVLTRGQRELHRVAKKNGTAESYCCIKLPRFRVPSNSLKIPPIW